MKITIACVGKIKEKYLTAGIEEFTKRLQPFCKCWAEKQNVCWQCSRKIRM